MSIMGLSLKLRNWSQREGKAEAEGYKRVAKGLDYRVISPLDTSLPFKARIGQPGCLGNPRM